MIAIYKKKFDWKKIPYSFSTFNQNTPGSSKCFRIFINYKAA